MPAEPSSPLPDDRQKRRVQSSRQFALAMELPFIVVSAVVIAGFSGYWLDKRLGTEPWLMIVLGALGLFAGIREMLRRLLKASSNADRKPQ